MDCVFICVISFICVLVGLRYAKSVLENLNPQKRSLSYKQIFFVSCFHTFLALVICTQNNNVSVRLYISIVSSLILVMSVIDQREKVIPNILLFLLCVISLMSMWILNVSFIDTCIGMCLGIGPLLIMFFINKNCVGSGDIYFLGMMGFMLGSNGVFVLMCVGYVSAFIYSLYLCIRGKATRKSELAMIPHFYLGYWVYLGFMNSLL